MIRVIGGRFRSRRLETVPGLDLTRPTSDRVKESLFNILAAELEGAVVLDLFSGTGALGIEALSRGARFCCFVEKNPAAAKVLSGNLARLGVGALEALVIRTDVNGVLANPAGFGLGQHLSRFDLVFADPPYEAKWLDGALDRLEHSNLLSKFCTVVFERGRYHEDRRDIAPESAFTLRMQRDYGKTSLEFWQRNG